MRKLRFFACVFLLFSSVSANAQYARKDSGVYISGNIGVNLPIAYFKSTSYTNIGGYAKNGYGVSLGIEHPMKPGWCGLLVKGAFYLNSFNLPAYQSAMSPYLTKYSFIQYNLTNATPYNEALINGGAYFQSKWRKVTLQILGSLGLDVVGMAYVDNTVTIGPSTFPIVAYPGAMDFLNHLKSAYIFDYCISFNAQYSLVKRLSIVVTASYISNFLSNFSEYPEGTYNIPISQFQFETGVSYHF